MNVKLFYDGVEFRLKGWRRIKKLIEKVIAEEGKIPGDLNFILTNDIVQQEMNGQFLKHNYFTDVISFSWGKKNVVDGEVYISVDTVKRNALNYKVSYDLEILRVIIHGVLHLCGYEDRSTKERKEMRRLENLYMEQVNSV